MHVLIVVAARLSAIILTSRYLSTIGCTLEIHSIDPYKSPEPVPHPGSQAVHNREEIRVLHGS